MPPAGPLGVVGGNAAHVLSPRQYCAVVPAAIVGSLPLSAVCVAVLIGLLTSLVLSTLPRPTAALSSVCQVLSPRQYCAVVPAAIGGSSAGNVTHVLSPRQYWVVVPAVIGGSNAGNVVHVLSPRQYCAVVPAVIGGSNAGNVVHVLSPRQYCAVVPAAMASSYGPVHATSSSAVETLVSA